MEDEQTDKPRHFIKRIWIATSIVLLVVVVIWMIKAIFSVLLLVFAGALIAIFFRGLAGLINRKFHIKKTGSLILGVIITLLLVSGFFVLAGARISQQVDELSRTLPSTIDKFKQDITESDMGRNLMNRLSSGGSMKKLSSVVQSFFKSSFGVLGDIYVVLFLGIYFTASPGIYMNGLIKLIPSKGKSKARHIVGELDENLKKWLKGKLFAMLVVALLTLIGLLILGIPMALVLSLMAGILNFIPNFGPLIAMIPAVLVALMKSPVIAAMVAGLYILVQVLESNLITPQIQKRLISMPPALIIIAQLIMGVLTGGWGLLLATPLILIVMIVVKELYISKMKGSE